MEVTVLTKTEILSLISETIIQMGKTNSDDKINQNNPTIPVEIKLYTIEELCSLLKVTRQTVHNWRKEGKLSYRKIGKRIYFSEDDLSRSMLRFDLTLWRSIPQQIRGGKYE